MSRTERERALSEDAGERRLTFQRRAAVSGLRSSGGWTLIELVITMTVMTVLTLAVIPMVKTSVRRQKEQRLRESLREIRSAIDEFHRDTVGMQCAAGGVSGIGGDPNTAPNVVPQNPNLPNQGQGFVDPRSRVVVSDCSIF